MLHVVYRVGDLDRTIKFYTECLGMKLLRKRDISEERYTNAFLGYGPEDSHFVIELTYNYGVDKYDIGAGFGHFGIAVDDVAKTVDLIKAKGGIVTREPGPVKGGQTVIAFIEDPDGYKFELLERGLSRFAYGMELLRKRDNPEYKYTIAMMGYGPEDKNAVMELTYNYGVTEYDKGNSYAQIAIGSDDVYRTAEAIKLSGGKITREPGPLPGISTKITACLDPDGWKTVFVDNIDFLKELDEPGNPNGLFLSSNRSGHSSFNVAGVSRQRFHDFADMFHGLTSNFLPPHACTQTSTPLRSSSTGAANPVLSSTRQWQLHLLRPSLLDGSHVAISAMLRFVI
ncbi:hypothetical protein DH2020_039377 [Rehmannia glutinosa]|uniref:lactoylglutathione lyase n=1 Tax=Rehmannia glutinosa TaxID=99300 RepID=A0ABR0UXN4_REHGL